MRVESPRALRNGGWFHPFASVEDARREAERRPIPVPAPALNDGRAEKLVRRWRAATSGLHALAGELGVTEESLRMLDVVFAPEYCAWAFPMRDAAGTICGIRLRSRTRKWAVKGSQEGLFFAPGAWRTMDTNRVWIVEGASDTAAGLALGLFTIGRPSCRGGVAVLVETLRQIDPAQVVIVMDNDGPGVAGAEALAEQIPYPRALWTAPCKDLRAYLSLGGTRGLLDSLAASFVWRRRGQPS